MPPCGPIGRPSPAAEIQGQNAWLAEEVVGIKSRPRSRHLANGVPYPPNRRAGLPAFVCEQQGPNNSPRGCHDLRHHRPRAFIRLPGGGQARPRSLPSANATSMSAPGFEVSAAVGEIEELWPGVEYTRPLFLGW